AQRLLEVPPPTLACLRHRCTLLRLDDRARQRRPPPAEAAGSPALTGPGGSRALRRHPAATKTRRTGRGQWRPGPAPGAFRAASYLPPRGYPRGAPPRPPAAL